MIFDDLIYDRTDSDLQQAVYLCKQGQNMTTEERTAFLAGLRGAYGPGDWNRVEESVDKLSDVLSLNLTTKTNWTAGDIWTQADSARYYSNLQTATGEFDEDYRLPDSMSHLDISGANGIEAALWVSATGLLWAQDGVVYASDGLLRITKQEVL